MAPIRAENRSFMNDTKDLFAIAEFLSKESLLNSSKKKSAPN